MDQEKIGKFIASCRKEKGLTQNNLAEKLQITNKAVSKWETGRGMPDASLLLSLCEILDINVNELLSGEKIKEEKYQIKAEENMIAIVNENNKNKVSNKKIILVFVVFVVLVMLILCMKLFIFFKEANVNNRINNYNPVFYQTNKRFNNISDELAVEIDNLKVSLKGYYFDGIDKEELDLLYLTEDEKNKIIKDSLDAELNVLVEISSLDESIISEIVFEHMIYDNNKNILSSNLGFINVNTPMYYDMYDKYIKKVPNANNDVFTLMNRNVRKSIIRDNLNSVLFLIRAEKNEDVEFSNIDLSKGHIWIIGPKYKNSQNEVIDLSEKIIDFVIKN